MALNSLIKDRFQYALIHCMYSCEVAIDAGKALQGEDSINVGITFSRQITTTAILRMKSL